MGPGVAAGPRSSRSCWVLVVHALPARLGRLWCVLLESCGGTWTQQARQDMFGAARCAPASREQHVSRQPCQAPTPHHSGSSLAIHLPRAPPPLFQTWRCAGRGVAGPGAAGRSLSAGSSRLGALCQVYTGPKARPKGCPPISKQMRKGDRAKGQAPRPAPPRPRDDLIWSKVRSKLFSHKAGPSVKRRELECRIYKCLGDLI